MNHNRFAQVANHSLDRSGDGRGLVLALLVALSAACQSTGGQAEAVAPPPPPPPPPAPAPAPQAEATPPPAPAPSPPIVVRGFQTPESMLYLASEDVYLVSNINGSPSDKDGNGFISKVDPEGKILELKWIEGNKNGVDLSAPKGMAVSGDALYVTDINMVKIFDLKTGAPKGKVGVSGSTFLNDAASAPDGSVFVSDSGMKFEKEGMVPTGTDGVYKIGARLEAERVAKDKSLGRPNGLAFQGDALWVVTAGTNELYRLDKDGKRQDVTKLPKGGLDGLIVLKDGSFLVSSWEAGSVYHGKPGAEFRAVVSNVKSPADIGYDEKRHRILIPNFLENSIELHTLAPVSPAAAPAPTLAPAAATKAAVPPAAAPAATVPPAAPATKPDPAVRPQPTPAKPDEKKLSAPTPPPAAK